MKSIKSCFLEDEEKYFLKNGMYKKWMVVSLVLMYGLGENRER